MLSVAAVGKIATGFWVRPLRKSEFFKVGFAMTAWGEFAFITAATAKEAGIIDAELFSSAILAVMLSVVVSPVLLRLVIVRNQKAAVASIASAKEHAARGGGTGDVPVYYRLQTRSAPSWGLNARLMDIVTTNSLQTLDFRSQHDERREHVTNELYLRDQTTHAPPMDVEFAAVSRRVGHLLALLSPLFSECGGTVSLDRWLPSAAGEGELSPDSALPAPGGDESSPGGAAHGAGGDGASGVSRPEAHGARLEAHAAQTHTRARAAKSPRPPRAPAGDSPRHSRRRRRTCRSRPRRRTRW